MTHEEDAHARFTGSLEHLCDRRLEGPGILDLAEDADLHVVDDEGQVLGVAGLFQGLGHGEAIGTFQDGLLRFTVPYERREAGTP